jgi:hypothetical protein
MKKLFMTSLVLCSVTAMAMPDKKELSQTQTLVNELMSSVVGDYKLKKKTAKDVAETAENFAKDAESEAAKFLLLKGAVAYYSRAGEYDKAADMVEALQSAVNDVPPEVLSEIISKATLRISSKNAPRLFAQYKAARAQVKAQQELKTIEASLKKRPGNLAARREYAELLAVSGDWKKALSEFAQLKDNAASIAKLELDGKAKDAELAEFWWSYKTQSEEAEDAIKARAAMYYKKAIDAGELSGLKKTLAEQRVASFAGANIDKPALVNSDEKKSQNSKLKVTASLPVKGRSNVAASKKNSSGLIHRWSFTESLDDSAGNLALVKSDNAKIGNGCVELQTCSPLISATGVVPCAPFTVQVWASATDKGLGAEGCFIFKIAPSPDSKDDSVYWTWRARTKWVSKVFAFGNGKSVGHGKFLVDGKKHLYTVTAEKTGRGMALKFYQDDTIFGELEAPKIWRKPPMLILGGSVSPTYDEVRVYSRALTHYEIVTTLNEGVDKVPALAK